ncbi:MAG: preprotein translocase subunit SecE [Phycisphaerales bacterium]
MAFGLYKPGQGYWMRVMTASIIGAIVLASAMWVASEAKRVASSLPVRSYTMQIEGMTGTPTAGSEVVFLRAAAQGEEPRVIGSGKIASYDSESGTLMVSHPSMPDKKAGRGEIASVRVDGAAGDAPVFRATVTSSADQPMVEPLYLQGISASVVLIVGAILAYWLCAVKPRTVNFLIDTDMEMKKVNWSTRRDIIASTYVVIGASFLIAALIFVTDLGLQWLFKTIGVLKS